MTLRQQVRVSLFTEASLIANMGDLIAIVQCWLSFFRYKNNELSNHTNQRHQQKNGLSKATNLFLSYSPEEHEQKLKSWWEIRLESQILRKRVKMQERGYTWGYVGTRKKKGTLKLKTTRKYKSEGTGERRKIKKRPKQDETIRTKKDIPKQRMKILPVSREKCTKTYQQQDAKEVKQFWSTIWKPGKHKIKAEMKSNMEKELQELEGVEAKMHLDLLNATLKNVPNWKTPSHDSKHGFWFKNYLASTTNWLSK